MNSRGIILFALLGASLISGVAVVSQKHQSRMLFVQLQSAIAERDALDIEWGQLQLEQSTWATHARIEEVAIQRLGMTKPQAGSSVILREGQ